MPKNCHLPQRSCVACGGKFAKRELIRVVRSPQGTVHVDQSGKSAGRGAYLCWSATCWQRGMGKGALERSLKLPLSPQDQAHLMSFYEKEVVGRSAEE